MNKLLSPRSLYYIICVLLFAGLFSASYSCGYFWDCIQQISREALWLYDNDWRGIFSPQFPGTGYHPPFMGWLTASLWHLFGKSVVVSHALVFAWSAVFAVSLWTLVCRFASGWRAFAVALVVLSMPALSAQFFIASPDFIMLSAFTLALAGLFSDRMFFYSLGLFFLAMLNMRGAIASLSLMSVVFGVYWRAGRRLWRLVFASAPVVLALLGYYCTRLALAGWFLEGSNYASHYSAPNFAQFVHGVADLGFRALENGQFVLWGFAIYAVVRLVRRREALSIPQQVVSFFAISQIVVFALLVVRTSMPFSDRYFLMLELAVALLSLPEVFTLARRVVFCVVIVIANLASHLCVYPEGFPQCWDCTLAHVGFYQLRESVIPQVLSTQGVAPDASNVQAGFCFYFPETEYNPGNSTLHYNPSQDSTDFYLYSNVSIEKSEFIEQLHDASLWQPIFSERRGFVFATLYKRVSK